MTIWERVKHGVAQWMKPADPFPSPARRSYAAGQTNRLTSGWTTVNKSAMAELNWTLPVLRARSRELSQNNDYAKKYLSLLKTNVVGPRGIVMQSKITNREGAFNTRVNTSIEDAWMLWGSQKWCDVAGLHTWKDLQDIIIESVARDGEVLIRKVRGFDNPFRFALQLIEIDHLDDRYTVDACPETGNRVRMGVEIDGWGRAVAYHLWVLHPGDMGYFAGQARQERQRVPASELLHIYDVERAEQYRGTPWLVTAMTRMNMLGGYEEAELVAARVGACKMGFFKTPTGNEYIGEGADSSGSKIDEAEPGIFQELPQGWDFQSFNPDHPSGHFQPFMKTALRGIASGLNVSYSGLSSDLEGVNYSSIRSGVVEERDYYRTIQQLLVSHFCQPVYQAWIEMAQLAGMITIPQTASSAAQAAQWQLRGWSWVDPLKDMEANVMAIDSGLKTRTQSLAEQGLDIEDVFIELSREKELAKQYGLEFVSAPATPKNPAPDTNPASVAQEPPQ